MEDVVDGSYLRAGGIWTALQRRRGIARLAAIKDALYQHVTRSVYEQSRADLMQLINRKITRKEYLIRQFDEQFTDALHKQIAHVEAEINTLLGVILSFDRMADFLANETAKAAEHWWKTDRQNILLNQMIDSYRDLHTTWSDLAFNLHDHCLHLQRNPANA